MNFQLINMLVISLLAATLATGCAVMNLRDTERAEAARAKFKSELDSWFGESARDLLDEYGAPTETIDRPGGGKIYVFEYRGDAIARTVAWEGFAKTQVSQSVCKITFMTDKKDIVDKVKWRGECYPTE